MKQLIEFIPKFNHESKRCNFSTYMSVELLNKLNVENFTTLRYVEPYGKMSPLDDDLKPTRYESYIYIDLGDNFSDWDTLWQLLGFDTIPSRYQIQSFKFGQIEIDCIIVSNEVGEKFLKISGNTTRNILYLIETSLRDWKDVFEGYDLDTLQ